MTATEHRIGIAFTPLVTGLSLWVAATALLLEDAYRANHWDVQHLAVPILTASTCVAGVLAHKALARLKFISGLALAVLAVKQHATLTPRIASPDDVTLAGQIRRHLIACLLQLSRLV